MSILICLTNVLVVCVCLFVAVGLFETVSYMAVLQNDAQSIWQLAFS